MIPLDLSLPAKSCAVGSNNEGLCIVCKVKKLLLFNDCITHRYKYFNILFRKHEKWLNPLMDSLACYSDSDWTECIQIR